MKEVTRIYNVQITKIIKDESELKSKEEAAKSLQTVLKMGLDVDDVVVEKVQDFELEK